MKAMLKLSLLLSFCFIFFSPSFAQDEDWMEVRTWIEMTAEKMETALLEGDGEYMMDLYAEDVYSLPSYEPMIKGKKKIMESHKKMRESGFKFNSVDFEVVDVMGSGNMAVEIGTYKMNMTIPGMAEPIDDNGKYITVWEKMDSGDWKIVADTWNSNINPWADMMGKEDMMEEEEDMSGE